MKRGSEHRRHRDAEDAEAHLVERLLAEDDIYRRRAAAERSGTTSLRDRGPYPTAALFDALDPQLSYRSSRGAKDPQKPRWRRRGWDADAGPGRWRTPLLRSAA